MMNKALSILSALAAAFALSASVVSPAAAAEASAAAPNDTPRWFCHKKGRGKFELSCRAICIGETGNFPPTAGGEVIPAWDCPDSDIRNKCDALVCSSAEECEMMGVVGYESCHDNGEQECAVQAQAATGAECVPPSNGG